MKKIRWVAFKNGECKAVTEHRWFAVALEKAGYTILRGIHV